jgi:hypothetical protein
MGTKAPATRGIYVKVERLSNGDVRTSKVTL